MRRLRPSFQVVLSLAGIGLASIAAVAAFGEESLDPTRPMLGAWKDGALQVPRGLPAPWIPPSNPLTPEKIALGKKLFFEKSLSRDRSKSCAHCHMPGLAFTDGLPTALGVGGQIGTRNAPSLVNAAIYSSLFWDGRAVSLEAQVEGPILAPGELDMTEALVVERIEANPEYGPLFAAAFGSPTISLRRAGHALASFERTLLAADSPFDRWWWEKKEDALDGAAQRGYVVYRTKGACASCHRLGQSEASFTDFEFHATGAGRDGAAPDVGRFAVSGKEEDRGRFRTPTLRNVAVTGPYFHDGSALTLREVIDHYDRGGKPGRPKDPEIRPLHLTEGEKQDLEAFLKALTSPALSEGPAPSPLDAPRASKDPLALLHAAEDALETSSKDLRALTALLIAASRIGDRGRLDEAIVDASTAIAERAAPGSVEAPESFRGAYGEALLQRARSESPADPERLKRAVGVLSFADGPGGTPEDALSLAYARHFLSDVPGARQAYGRALLGSEALADRALDGIQSLLGGTEEALAAELPALAKEAPNQAAVLRRRAKLVEKSKGAEAALALLQSEETLVLRSPRTMRAKAALLRKTGAELPAVAIEREVIALAGDEPTLSSEIEVAWRGRTLSSFADCEALDADFRLLLARAAREPYLQMAYRNDLAFLLREVVSTYTWRGEGRSQGIAEGAPKEARTLLDRCLQLYEEAAAAIPKDAMDRPFAERWVYAGVWNDLGLMRHYWVDLRDLTKAEACYRKAFDLTDGAYMDTYFYNLQYLYGFEMPGHEESWFRLARRAAESILKPSADGGFVPDERKRDAARRDADALKSLLESRK